MYSPGIEIVGISTVFGNAPLSVVDRTTRALVGRIAGYSDTLVQSGSSTALESERPTSIEPAHAALERALESGPLTIVSLGPLTNVAATLQRRPDLADNIGLLVTVMGRQPGHVFHPTEGRSSSGILFGHGPIFRDFNFAKDRTSAAIVLRLVKRISLTPYAAAREVMVTRWDVERMFLPGSPWTIGCPYCGALRLARRHCSSAWNPTDHRLRAHQALSPIAAVCATASKIC
jgi:purine nucleosidase